MGTNNQDKPRGKPKKDYKIPSEYVEKNMTRTEAQVIHALRLSCCTFGRISEIMNELLGWERGQYVGRLYAKKAAQMLDQDFNWEPWN